MTQANLFIDGEAHGRAILSDDGLYRYTLERAWASIPRYVLWLMLNPSTADATTSDPTIRRCLSFTRSWKFTGLLVGNLYGFRATSPRELWVQARQAGEQGVRGPENQRHLVGLCRRAAIVVCAWGQPGPIPHVRGETLCAIRAAGHQPHYLRMNETGEPSHPLYLPGVLKPTRWPVFDQAWPGHGP